MPQQLPGSSTYYFSESLLSALAEIWNFGLTVVEAPSGFGKTTAVREFLSQYEDNADIRWYTCFGESPRRAWKGICALFGDCDSLIFESLLDGGVPDKDNLADIARSISTLSCPKTSVIVIDNYQLFKIEVQKRLLMALSTCSDTNTHIVVITQPLPEDETGMTCHGGLYHTIGVNELFFDAECIARFCRKIGQRISQEAIEKINDISHGWVAAIRLHLLHYGETDSLINSGNINALVERALWNRISGRQQELLLGLALLENFTMRQAAVMGSGTTMPDMIAELLRMDFFMRYLADKHAYTMHGILRCYLLQRFELYPQDFRHGMLRKAADACVESGDYLQAAHFLLEIHDFDALFSLPISTEYIYDNQERNITVFFKRILDECPVEIFAAYPIRLVIIAYNFFRRGVNEYLDRALYLIRHLLQTHTKSGDAVWYRVRGEYAMLMSFSEYNNIARMGQWHKKAEQCLLKVSSDPRSEVFKGGMPFGTVSVLCLYWSKAGRLTQLLKLMDKYLPVYSRLAGGHGAGAEHIFRAEACLNSGDLEGAALMARKAIVRGQLWRQQGIVFSAELILGYRALWQGNTAEYLCIRRRLEERSGEAEQNSLRRLGELAWASLDLSISSTEKLPSWLRSPEGIQKVVYAHSIPYAQILYGHLLLLEKRYDELHQLTDIIMPMAQQMHYVLPQLCQNIYLAVAESHRHPTQAVTYVEKALQLALPDKFYMPFALFARELLPLLKRVNNSSRKIQELIEVCRRFDAGRHAVLHGEKRKENKEELLTPRETEVAVLARERFSAKEIADQLSVSVNTVNTMLKNIYRKLDINSKTELKDHI